MFHLMAYNKDQDRYDEWQAGTLQAVQAEALFCRDLLMIGWKYGTMKVITEKRMS